MCVNCDATPWYVCYLQAATPMVETQVSGAAQVWLRQASGAVQPASRPLQDDTWPHVVVLRVGGSGRG